MPTMISVRVDQDVFDLVEKAAADAGVSRSMWLREWIVAAATGRARIRVSNGQEEPAPHPRRALQLQGRSVEEAELVGTCMHPKTAYKRLPYMTVCTLCGARVR